MTKKEKILVAQAKQLTSKAIDKVSIALGHATQDNQDSVINPLTEVLAILGGLLFEAPK